MNTLIGLLFGVSALLIAQGVVWWREMPFTISTILLQSLLVVVLGLGYIGLMGLLGQLLIGEFWWA